MSILALLIIINLLSAADGTMTWYGLRERILFEYNPIALFFISKFGITWGITTLKAIVPTASIILFRHKDQYSNSNPVFFALYAAAGAYFLVVSYLAYGLIDWAVNN